ncbi:unnamed protein product [Arabidopsis halleri]
MKFSYGVLIIGADGPLRNIPKRRFQSKLQIFHGDIHNRVHCNQLYISKDVEECLGMLSEIV